MVGCRAEPRRAAGAVTLQKIFGYRPLEGLSAGARRLHIGTGYLDNVSPEVWAYEVSGKQVLTQWFSYRGRDRSRPIIGASGRHPHSPTSSLKDGSPNTQRSTSWDGWWRWSQSRRTCSATWRVRSSCSTPSSAPRARATPSPSEACLSPWGSRGARRARSVQVITPSLRRGSAPRFGVPARGGQGLAGGSSAAHAGDVMESGDSTEERL
jgi:Type ISP C-terminal specificity domain